MSYMEIPRIVFSGRFQADVSTVNNEVRHYDNAAWSDAFQQMQEPRQPDGSTRYNGWWNPDGTGAFRLIDVVVTGGDAGEGPVAHDPVISLKVASNLDLPPAKLVDLDPQFQMGSMIWGLQIVLTDGETEYLRGDFEAAPFRDLFFLRVDRQRGSGYASAKFASLLKNLKWNDRAPPSRLLAALRQVAAANDDCLSINLMTFAYDTGARNPTFTLGRVVGAIGPWRSDEPRSFTLGRRFAPAANTVTPFATAADNIGFFDAVVGEGSVHLDLGNALPLRSRAGELVDLGRLDLVVLNQPDGDSEGEDPRLKPGCPEGAIVTEADYRAIGEIDYRAPGWLMRTAGIVSLPIDADAAAQAAASPLALVVTDAVTGKARVAIRETIGGYLVRADDFEHRVDAARAAPVRTQLTLRCARFGRPLAGAIVRLQLAPPDATEGGNGGPPTGIDPRELDPLPKVLPTINVPPEKIRFAGAVTSDPSGAAKLVIELDDPANCRQYLDGQIFTLIYGFDFSGGSAMPLYDRILLHVRDGYDPPAAPDWTVDVEPVLRQFGNLYPIMSRGLFSFSDRAVVAERAAIMMFALQRPIEDPNHMPATRDLSAAKREMLLSWLAGMAAQPRPAPPPAAAPPHMLATVVEAAAEALPAAQLGRALPASYAEFSRMKGRATEDFEAPDPASDGPDRR